MSSGHQADFISDLVKYCYFSKISSTILKDCCAFLVEELQTVMKMFNIIVFLEVCLQFR